MVLCQWYSEAGPKTGSKASIIFVNYIFKRIAAESTKLAHYKTTRKIQIAVIQRIICKAGSLCCLQFHFGPIVMASCFHHSSRNDLLTEMLETLTEFNKSSFNASESSSRGSC